MAGKKDIVEQALKLIFSGSKAVDEAGVPVRYYHGTTHDLPVVKPGTYFTEDPGEGSAYTFWTDLANAEKRKGKYSVISVPEMAGKRLEYFGTISDIDGPEVGKFYATDNGIMQYGGGGKWSVASDVGIDDQSLDMSDYTIGVKPRDNSEAAQNMVNEYEETIKRAYPGGVGGNVIPAYLNVKNPKEMPPLEGNRFGERLGADPKWVAGEIEKLKSQGYDSIVTTSDDPFYAMERKKPPKQYIIFEPTQVKSAVGNSGEYDFTNPRIDRNFGGRTGYAGKGRVVGSVIGDAVDAAMRLVMGEAEKAAPKIRAYHASPHDFDVFKPSEFRGSTFFASTPERAKRGADAGRNEMVMETATDLPPENYKTYEVEIDPTKIRGLHLAPSEIEWFSKLPNKIVGDEALDAATRAGMPHGLTWDDFYDYQPISEGVFEYTKKAAPPSITYEDAYKTGRDVYRRQHPHYAPDADEKTSAERMRQSGMGGYMLQDEGGTSLAVSDPEIVKILRKYASGGRTGYGPGGVIDDVVKMAGKIFSGAEKTPSFKMPTIRPSTDNLSDVGSANFDAFEFGGDKMLPIESLNGGVNLSDPSQRRRVDALKSAISNPDTGYISRLVVDQDGNVIEGQHRLDALRESGATEAPVSILRDKTAGIDVPKLKAAITSQGGIHGDHVNQLVDMLMDADQYDPPPGFEKFWNAGLKELGSQKGRTGYGGGGFIDDIVKMAGKIVSGADEPAKTGMVRGTFPGSKMPSVDALSRNVDKFVYHSGTAKDIPEMKYGVSPQIGPWVREVLEGSADDDAIDEIMENAVPVSWWSKEPSWAVVKVARELGKPIDQVTPEDLASYGHVALIPKKDPEAESLYWVGEEGLNMGPYSDVEDITGRKVKAYDADLYSGNYGPEGVEKNEYITPRTVEPYLHLTGNELVDFLRKTGQYKKASGGRLGYAGRGRVAGDIVDQALKLVMGGAEEPAKTSIRAYQGSPHNFAAERLVRFPDKTEQYIVGTPDVLPDVPEGAEVIQDFPLGRMRMDKIGTGEGAQAYGHGLYAAEAEDVAQGYRQRLANVDASEADKIGIPPNYWNAFTMFAKQADETQAEAAARDFANWTGLGFTPDLVRAFDNTLKSRGRMYEVNIAADPNTFLDWDKPLSEQPEAVQKAVSNISNLRGESGGYIWDSLVKQKNAEGAFGEHMADLRPAIKTGPKAAQEYLREAGIPGIKYFDAGSRGAGEGTRNYVVFDDRLISIIRKYGIAGASAMLGYNLMEQLDPKQALAASMADQDYQSSRPQRSMGGNNSVSGALNVARGLQGGM